MYTNTFIHGGAKNFKSYGGGLYMLILYKRIYINKKNFKYIIILNHSKDERTRLT